MSRLALLLTLIALAAAPATALAAPPWSAPVQVPGVIGQTTPIAVTPSGAAVLLAQVGRDALGSTGAASEVVPLGADGRPGVPRPVSLVAGLLTTYAKGHIAVAGSTLVDGTNTDRSHATVALGTPSNLGPARGLTDSTGQHVFGLAGNVRGDLAVVTGDASHVRTVYLRRAGSTAFRVALKIPVSRDRARGATVALGPNGDLLVVWEDNHVIYARHRGASGRWGGVHRVGDGVQSQLEAAIDDRRRLEVAWKSQRVSGGESIAPAIVRFATAAPDHGFGPQRTVEAVGGSGTGRYLSAPGVRLVPEVSSRALLAWTGFDNGHFVVRATDVVEGHRGLTQTVSPPTEDSVLGDAAARSDGAAIVVWRSGVQGADPVPGQPPTVFASHRDINASAFGAPERVSLTGESVLTAPFAALDPVTGRSFAAYSLLDGGVWVSARP
jgi:hypothetical protein